MTTKPAYAMARCKRCKDARRVEGIARYYPQGPDKFGVERTVRRVDFQPVECWNGCKSRVIGDTTVEINEIRGVRTDCPCDARCTQAKGHQCECSCAGKNHGTGR